MTKNNIFSCHLDLPYSAVNANGRVKVDWLLNAFQDTASQQCHTLGISGFDMAKKQLKWVVAQYKINIHDQIPWLAPLTLSTWRTPWKNLYEIRGFSMGINSKPPLVTAESIWILTKASNGKPVRLKPYMPEILMQDTAEPAELIKPKDDFGEYQHEAIFPVQFIDLDLNQHVNNRVYLRWAVESLPDPYCFEYTPVTCEVIYRKEGLFKDKISSRIRMIFSDSGLTTHHSIRKTATQEELARLTLCWKKLYLTKSI
ncbi:MAG: hypothetical protein HUK40_21925 [Desulfobacter sp.]|nr:hypothetical protein [Desulfobacter sp.]